MMRFSILCGMLGLASALIAQSLDTVWTARIDYNRSDYGYAIARGLNGDLVVAGSTRPLSESATAYFQTLSMDGEIGFNRIYEDEDGLRGFRDIIATSDSGYIAAGRGNGGTDFVVARLDSLGEVEWVFESPLRTGLLMEAQVLETNNNRILVVQTGGSTSFGDNYLMMFDSNGDTLWTRQYGGQGHQLIMEASELENRDFCFYGSQNNPENSQLCGYVLLTDSLGDEVWSNYYTFDDRTVWTSWGAPIGNSGHIVGGYLEDVNYQKCVFAMRLDSEGEVIWQTDFDCQYQGATYCGGKISDEEFLLCGYSQGVPFIVAFNGDEEVLWTQTYPELDSNVPLDMKILDSNSLVITGYTTDFDNYDIYVVSMDRPEALEQPRSAVSRDFVLHPCYPNPFNASTTLSYDLPITTQTHLAIYDVLGREVDLLVEGTMTAGTHKVLWEARGVASGIYFARLEAGSRVMTRKLLLLR